MKLRIGYFFIVFVVAASIGSIIFFSNCRVTKELNGVPNANNSIGSNNIFTLFVRRFMAGKLNCVCAIAAGS